MEGYINRGYYDFEGEWMMTKVNPLVQDYILELEEKVQDLPYAQVKEFIMDIESHISDGLEREGSASESGVRASLARVGDATELAQDFREKMNAPPQVEVVTPGRRMNTSAIAAMILGIMGLFIPIVGIVLGIAAIILGRKSLQEIKKTNESGSELGITRIILGVGAVLLYGLMLLGMSFYTYSTSILEQPILEYHQEDLIDTPYFEH